VLQMAGLKKLPEKDSNLASRCGSGVGGSSDGVSVASGETDARSSSRPKMLGRYKGKGV
jgi:hypothetical protein